MPLLLIFIVGAFFTELWVLVQVGGQIGAFTTVVATLVTAALGIALVKRQGLQTLARAQEKMTHGDSPAQEMLEGVALFVAGIFLLLPGFVSDFIGLLLLIPPFRAAFAKRFLKNTQGYTFMSSRFRSQYRAGSTYDGEFTSSTSENDTTEKKNQKFLP